MGMTQVTLTGQLICEDADQATRVSTALPAHIAATRAEPGCLSFDVIQTADPLIWQVDERFVSVDAFEAHQARAATTAWATLTKDIKRHNSIQGLP